MGADGRPLPQVYRISDSETREIRFRMLDAVNSLREANGAPPLDLDERLTAAAATHSRDMAVQSRPWHFGSDGSSPVDRINRVGYDGRLIGEAISETYETELETLAAWMQDEDHAARDPQPRGDAHGLCLAAGAERQDLVDDGAGQRWPAQSVTPGA